MKRLTPLCSSLAKGQLISKAICQAVDCLKKTNELICFFWLAELLPSKVKRRLFIFLENLRLNNLLSKLTNLYYYILHCQRPTAPIYIPGPSELGNRGAKAYVSTHKCLRLPPPPTHICRSSYDPWSRLFSVKLVVNRISTYYLLALSYISIFFYHQLVFWPCTDERAKISVKPQVSLKTFQLDFFCVYRGLNLNLGK